MQYSLLIYLRARSNAGVKVLRMHIAMGRNQSPLEKRNKTKSHICHLIGQNDDELTSPRSILNEIKSFYSNIYLMKSVKTEQDYLQYPASINMPKLSERSESQREECEGRLTLLKC